jgi:hypothetical protein
VSALADNLDGDNGFCGKKYFVDRINKDGNGHTGIGTSWVYAFFDSSLTVVTLWNCTNFSPTIQRSSYAFMSSSTL